MSSLRARVALSAALVILLFIVLASAALERAFRESARAAREERLLGQLYLLMAAAEEEGASLRLPDTLAEARFSLPGSGLYAEVTDGAGRPVWRSGSSLGLLVPFGRGLDAGQRRFEVLESADGTDYFVESFGVAWATDQTPRPFTFSVAEDLDEYDEQLTRFRASLTGWLGALALLLLASLWVTLRWGLAPLRQVAAEVESVEAGRQERIEGGYPSELEALTRNLNALLAHERAQQERLGNALGDLSHSLKTPLAVIRNSLPEAQMNEQTAATVDEQLTRIEKVIEYQLQRARSGGRARLGSAVPIGETVRRIVESLAKVYRNKSVRIVERLDPEAVFRGVEGDLMEMLGNVLDNAHKWCRTTIRVSVSRSGTGQEIAVEDDGPGVDADKAPQLLARGARADEGTPGQGIGLAVVRDICDAYGGTLSLVRSDLGGARVVLRLP